MMIPRFLLAAICVSAVALAAPPLTTIQDLLYKADGTRFSGTLTISWKSFDAPDNSAIVMQSTTVRVQEGNLRVQLVPTTATNPPVYYSVIYSSDGRIQFRETWSVPAGTQPVRLRDVRVAVTTGGSTGGGTTTPGQVGTIQESDVEGLIADLEARPIKGPGFAPDRVVMSSSTGTLESVTGAPNECVRVDGSSAACGGSTIAFVDGEPLSGIVDGANTFFTLASTPDPPSSLAIYRNGLLQKVDIDYSATGRNIEFLPDAVPQTGDILLAAYRLTGASSESPPFFSTTQVLCTGIGTSTSESTPRSLGACTIPTGILLPGDRVELRFDYEHSGAASGFSIEVLWGASVVVQRAIAASETLVSGGATAGLSTNGAQLAVQSWGSSLSFLASVTTASESYTNGLVIDFRGAVAAPADALTLRNFSVVRLP